MDNIKNTLVHTHTHQLNEYQRV